MKKRYKPSDTEHDTYNDYYVRFISESKVFNSEKFPSAYTIFWDKETLEVELFNLTGDKNGIVDGEKFGAIPYANEVLAAIEKQFQNYCRSQVAEGRSKPQTYPPDLLQKKLKCEARIDVLTGEKEMIEKRLQSIKSEVQKTDDTLVLKNGPKGSAQLQGGVIVTIDGMKCTVSKEGVPYIRDKRAGVFDGYSCADYIQFVVQPWAFACAKKAKLNADEAKKNGIRLDQLSKGKLNGTNTPWPSMPETCVNYIKIKANVEIVEKK
jgi:hypothetical protein